MQLTVNQSAYAFAGSNPALSILLRKASQNYDYSVFKSEGLRSFSGEDLPSPFCFAKLRRITIIPFSNPKVFVASAEKTCPLHSISSPLHLPFQHLAFDQMIM
jgi:hypothetical protein